MTKNEIALPQAIGPWTRPDSARIIDSNNIFEYMNGAGELYLAYGFHRLEVFEYTSEKLNNILVEVYYMNHSNDAFGLLSLDWGGVPVIVYPQEQLPKDLSMVPSARALYGGGLLRIWADTIYARVMAYHETEQSKEAVLSLGRIIGKGRKMPEHPQLLTILPVNLEQKWELRKDRIGYFRSHLVLNSLYYLSHQNILQLDHSSEAVAAPYLNQMENGSGKNAHILIVNYKNATLAQEALTNFLSIYLEDKKNEFRSDPEDQQANYFQIEDGWMGYSKIGRYLAIVFECPDRKSAEMFINRISKNLLKEE